MHAHALNRLPALKITEDPVLAAPQREMDMERAAQYERELEEAMRPLPDSDEDI